MKTDFPLEEHLVEERFVRASGPGGQNVNKVSTAVELLFDVAASSLPDEVKARLRTLAGRRLASDGRVIIDSRVHRTQGQNREAARVRLVALIAKASVTPRRRRPTRPKPAVKAKRLSSKRERGALKARRTKRPADDE